MAMAITMAKINSKLQSKIISSPKAQHFPRDASAETYLQVARGSLCIFRPSKLNPELVSPSYNSHTQFLTVQFS